MELSKEEKKTIEELKEFIEDDEIQNISVFTAKKIKNIIEQQQKEIEEKTTIIMAGAEKVKQLEKEIQRLEKDNDTLSELVIVNEDKVIKELDLISKDKIREKIEKIDKEYAEIIEKYKNNLEVVNINAQRHDAMQLILEELLEE